MTLSELIQEYHNKYITPDVLLEILTNLSTEELNKLTTLDKLAEPSLVITEYSSGEYFVELCIEVDYTCVTKIFLGAFTDIKPNKSNKKIIDYPCYMSIGELATKVINERLDERNEDLIESLVQDINSQSLSLSTITKLLNNAPIKTLSNLRLKLNHKHNYRCYITLDWEREHVEMNFLQGNALNPSCSICLVIDFLNFEELKEKVKPKLMNKHIYTNKYLLINLCLLITDLTGE